MNAFAAGVNAIFADRNMAVDAEYRAGGVDPAVIVRVIKASPSVVTDWSRSSFVHASHIFDVRVSDVAAPREGDTFTIAGTVYSVREEPLLDSDGLCWKLGMRHGA